MKRSLYKKVSFLALMPAVFSLVAYLTSCKKGSSHNLGGGTNPPASHGGGILVTEKTQSPDVHYNERFQDIKFGELTGSNLKAAIFKGLSSSALLTTSTKAQGRRMRGLNLLNMVTANTTRP